MNTYEWRQSGKDALLHAFPAEGGYMQHLNLISVVQLRTDNHAVEELFGPYEGFIAECGLIVPVAMLLPHALGQRQCIACQLYTGATRPSKPSRESTTTALAAQSHQTPSGGEPAPSRPGVLMSYGTRLQ